MSGILDLKLKEATYTVFDLETTGMSMQNGDRIVEAAFVQYSFSGGVLKEFCTLINPQRSIPWDVSAIHGICDTHVKNAPKFRNFVRNILDLIAGTILVGHNVYFDMRFLTGEMSQLGIEINHPHICTMGYPGFNGGKTQLSLQKACDLNGISLLNAHSALDDTHATVKLLERHIQESSLRGLNSFRDLKKTDKQYKFISSWDMPIPTYKDVLKGWSGCVGEPCGRGVVYL